MYSKLKSPACAGRIGRGAVVLDDDDGCSGIGSSCIVSVSCSRVINPSFRQKPRGGPGAKGGAARSGGDDDHTVFLVYVMHYQK